jgi:hypothetical protein
MEIFLYFPVLLCAFSLGTESLGNEHRPSHQISTDSRASGTSKGYNKKVDPVETVSDIPSPDKEFGNVRYKLIPQMISLQS